MIRSHLANSFTRASVLLAAAVVALIVVTASPAVAAPVSCTAPVAGDQPPRDINSYVLFGISDMNIKGGNGGRGVIAGGNVGVQSAGGVLHVGANHDFITDTGSSVVADVLDLGAETKVDKVYGNSGTINDAAVHGAGPTCYTLPTVNNLPPERDVTPGNSPADDITVNAGNSPYTLAPGHYGKLSVQDGTTLNITAAGEYHFLEVHTGDGSTINTGPGTDVRIRDYVNFADDAVVQGSDLARFYVDKTSPDQVVQFGKRTEFHGQIYAPNGRVALGHSTDLFGRFWANDFSSDVDVNITYSGPETPQLNTTASGTVVLGGKIHDTAHLTGGSNPTGTITFDLYGPNDANCSKAKLATYAVPVNGAGNYNSPDYTTTAVGTYRWIAAYSGDVNNTAVSGACNDDGEAVVVTDKPCVPTAGQDANCKPIVVNCVPTAGQDANCQPIPATPVTPKTTDSAKVSGVKAGCSTTSNVKVSGSNIKKVTYKIDGKTVKTVNGGSATYRLKTKDYKFGVHKLKVTTTFKSGKTKTQTLTFQHCRQARPHFTG